MKSKTIIATLILSLIALSSFSQTIDQKEKLKTTEGTYQLDSDYGYSYVYVFENLNGNIEELYGRSLSFFPYIIKGTYDARKIIQHEDKSAGLIVAKIAHSNIASRINLGHTYVVHATPIWKIDIKDNRIRLTITNKKWLLDHENRSGIFVTNNREEIVATRVAPFAETKPKMDKMYVDAFLVLHSTVQSLTKKFEDYITENKPTTETKDEKW